MATRASEAHRRNPRGQKDARNIQGVHLTVAVGSSVNTEGDIQQRGNTIEKEI